MQYMNYPASAERLIEPEYTPIDPVTFASEIYVEGSEEDFSGFAEGILEQLEEGLVDGETEADEQYRERLVEAAREGERVGGVTLPNPRGRVQYDTLIESAECVSRAWKEAVEAYGREYGYASY